MCVPAGPQDSSVGDSGHTGHWAQRVIEPSPVQNRIRQDRMGGGARDTVKAVRVFLFCFFCVFLFMCVVIPLRLQRLGLDGRAVIWLEEN